MTEDVPLIPFDEKVEAIEGTIPLYFPMAHTGDAQVVIGNVRITKGHADIELQNARHFSDYLQMGAYVGMVLSLPEGFRTQHLVDKVVLPDGKFYEVVEYTGTGQYHRGWFSDRNKANRFCEELQLTTPTKNYQVEPRTFDDKD